VGMLGDVECRKVQHARGWFKLDQSRERPIEGEGRPMSWKGIREREPELITATDIVNFMCTTALTASRLPANLPKGRPSLRQSNGVE
jgi:hypothetical protein